MTTFQAQFDQLDRRITQWMAHNGITLLRISLGVVFVWFGALKFFPHQSPAEELIFDTLSFLPFPLSVFMVILATWEVAIGVGFIIGKWMRVTILLLFLQMPGTMSPILLNADAVFANFPFALTLEGQYIIKNLVLMSAALVIGATVRGGQLNAEPLVASESAV